MLLVYTSIVLTFQKNVYQERERERERESGGRGGEREREREGERERMFFSPLPNTIYLQLIRFVTSTSEIILKQGYRY